MRVLSLCPHRRRRLFAALRTGTRIVGLCGLLTVPAHASLKQDAAKVGRSLGTAAHDVGHTAKKIGVTIGHEARHVAIKIGHAARAGGIEFWHSVKGH